MSEQECLTRWRVIEKYPVCRDAYQRRQTEKARQNQPPPTGSTVTRSVYSGWEFRTFRRINASLVVSFFPETAGYRSPNFALFLFSLRSWYRSTRNESRPRDSTERRFASRMLGARRYSERVGRSMELSQTFRRDISMGGINGKVSFLRSLWRVDAARLTIPTKVNRVGINGEFQ